MNKIEQFKQWHKSHSHDFDTACSCGRCSAIADMIEWGEIRLSEASNVDEKSIGDYFLGNELQLYPDYSKLSLTFKNTHRTDIEPFVISYHDPEFGVVRAEAEQYGYKL